VEGRIKALSRAHTVLSQSRWQGADLRGLVEEELAPYRVSDAEKIKTNGPEILLQPAPAQTLALALHELATNAAKYGALSSMSGKLKLSWQSINDNLVLDWNETGGPATEAPTTGGFGTRIILASIESQLRGQADFNWRREGLRCKISVPLCNAIETVSEESHDVAEATITGAGIVLDGGSIMLVEDEVIVALAVSDSLADLGFSVIGPFTRVSDACRALTENQVDAAILDVNLDGEMVYGLAKMLDDRKIPFVFATGYGSESIEPGFEHIPVLQKPIERDMLSRIFVLSNAAKNSIQKAPAIALQRGETANQPVV
jgi:CheY-like chemotaxis protein